MMLTDLDTPVYRSVFQPTDVGHWNNIPSRPQPTTSSSSSKQLQQPKMMQLDFLTPYTHLLLDSRAISAADAMSLLDGALAQANAFVREHHHIQNVEKKREQEEDLYCRRVEVLNPLEPRDGSYSTCVVGVLQTRVSDTASCWAIDLQRRSNTKSGGECAYAHHLFQSFICKIFAPYVFGTNKLKPSQTKPLMLLAPLPLPLSSSFEGASSTAHTIGHLARMSTKDDAFMLQALLSLCIMSTDTCPYRRSLLRMVLGIGKLNPAACPEILQAYHDSHHILARLEADGYEARRLSKQIRSNLACF